MTRPAVPPRTRLHAALSPEASTEPTYQRRLAATFAALAAIVAVLNVVGAIVYLLGSSYVRSLTTSTTLAQSARLPVLAVGWLLCRRFRWRPARRDRIDETITLLTMTLTALPIASHAPHSRHDGVSALLFLFSFLALRDALVPATARRAIWIAVMAATPLLIAA